MDCLPCLMVACNALQVRQVLREHERLNRYIAPPTDPAYKYVGRGRHAGGTITWMCYACFYPKTAICGFGRRCVVCTLPGGSCEHTPEWVRFAFESKLEDPVCRCTVHV